MLDSGPTDAERIMQPKFSIRVFAAGLVLVAGIALFDQWLLSVPNRHELGWRDARIAFKPVRLTANAPAPLRLAGAWELTSDDPRFGGISALAIDGGRLLALTDSGVLVRFRPRTGSAQIGELPDGPGSGRFKRNRDSEALVRDPHGRGWWVTFENRHELWLYDRGFRRPLERIRLGERGWSVNRGVEGAAADDDRLLLFEEAGKKLLPVRANRARSIPIANARGRISDAVSIGRDQYLAIERQLTPLGFRNSLVTVAATRGGYRFGGRIALPLGPFDNVEAIAVERIGNRRRLWLMTDDNFQPPLRTLLIALDLSDPPSAERGGG